MNFEFNLPDIGEGLVEGEIVKWFVKVGDTVAEHQPLAAVLTDKAEVEIPSPKAGKIIKLYGKPGEKIKVHSPLASIDVAGGAAAAATTEKVAVKNSVAAPRAPAAQSVAVAERPAASSGAFVFTVPDIGEGLVEGELVKWHVKEGDVVEEHQPIAAVLTDKAEVEIPSPKTGTIAKLHAKPGEKVKVHGPLVTYSGVKGSVGTSAPSVAVTADSPKAAAASAAPRPSKPASEVLATPMVRKMAKDQGIDIGQVQGTGPEGRVLATDLAGFTAGGFAAATPSRVASYDNSGAKATPAVKNLASALGVDLSKVKGTGPGGRIAEGDVRAAAPAAAAAAAAPAAPTATTATARQEPVLASTTSSGYPPVSISRQDGDTTVPFTGIRRKIAEKMQQSKRTVAHVTHVDECDMTAVLALRESLKPEAAKRGVKLTFLPFILKALIKALQEFPNFNASLDEAAGELVIKRF
ncbi:MAG: DUF2118 domain-containing protein, partial [Elusimicrobia bacterium]|nr:DUF2118 domain-containing protein [Elusimicrobiota bacterium]